MRPQILPTPWLVISQGWDFRSAIWANSIPTLEETFIGFAVSLACAFILAAVMELWWPCRRALYPFLIISQTLPLIAIAPLVDIWLGFGLLPKLVVVAIVTFFPITVGLTEGFASADPDAVNLLRSMGASRLGCSGGSNCPGPCLLLRRPPYRDTYAVVGAIFAEYVGASSGLGIFMSEQANQFRTDLVYAAVAVIALLSVALFTLTYLVQRLTIPWYQLSRRTGSARSPLGRGRVDRARKAVRGAVNLRGHGPSGCGTFIWAPSTSKIDSNRRKHEARPEAPAFVGSASGVHQPPTHFLNRAIGPALPSRK